MLQQGRPGWHRLSDSITGERSEIEGKTVCGLSRFSRVQLCDPMDCSPPGSSVRGISQARMLEWVAMPPPGDLPDPGIKPVSLTSPALTGVFFTTSTTWETQIERWRIKNGAWQGSSDGAPEPGMNEPFPVGTPLRRK